MTLEELSAYKHNTRKLASLLSVQSYRQITSMLCCSQLEGGLMDECSGCLLGSEEDLEEYVQQMLNNIKDDV